MSEHTNTRGIPLTGLVIGDSVGQCAYMAATVGMDDGEFWDYIFNGPELPGWEDDYFDQYNAEPPADEQIRQPCTVCGATGECGYDVEGRPFIHVEDEEL